MVIVLISGACRFVVWIDLFCTKKIGFLIHCLFIAGLAKYVLKSLWLVIIWLSLHKPLVVSNCQTEWNHRFSPWIGTLYWDYCNVVFTLASIVGQKHQGMRTHHNCHLLAWLLDHYVCLQKLEIRYWVSDICQTVIGWKQFMCLVIETYCVICINQREFAVDQSTLVILWFDWLTSVLSIFVTK